VGVFALPQLIANLVIPGANFVLAASQGRLRDRWAATLVVVAFAATQFFLGMRSNATMPLVALLLVWDRCVKRLRRKTVLLAGVVMMVVVFPAVRIVRNTTGQDRMNPTVIVHEYESIDNPAVDILTELGYTMVTVAHTIALVPAERAHPMGEGYLYALFTIVPNFFWTIHPTIARGTDCIWLAERVEPLMASRGGSLGYSFIAEAYLEFGWYGAPIVMFLTGVGVAAFVLWARRSGEPAKLAATATFVAFFLRYPRDESASLVRMLVWYVVVPYWLVADWSSVRHRVVAAS
jgi:oligosaccharide repeat unit polymerase